MFPLNWRTWMVRYCSKETHFSSSFPATTIISQIPTSDVIAPLWSTCVREDRVYTCKWHRTTVFLQSDATATIYFTTCFMQLLFEGGVYFFGKPRDINDGWIRYVRVRWWRLLDAVSSTHSLSVLLSGMGTTRTTQHSPSASVVTVIRNHSHTCACAAFTSCDYYSRAAFITSKSFGLCGYYSRAVTIRGRCLFEEIRCNMYSKCLHACL